MDLQEIWNWIIDFEKSYWYMVVVTFIVFKILQKIMEYGDKQELDGEAFILIIFMVFAWPIGLPIILIILFFLLIGWLIQL